MAFTYDISTDRGKTRLGLGDTTAAAYVFEDEEIDYFLSKGGSVNEGIICGLRTLLASKAHRIKDAKVNGLEIDDTKQIEGIQAAITALGGFPTIKTIQAATRPFDRGYVETSS